MPKPTPADDATLRTLQRDQAAMLSNVVVLFVLVGTTSVSLFTAAFQGWRHPDIAAAYMMVIALYGGLLTTALRWQRNRRDAAFISMSVQLIVGLGVAWGLLVNLFALHSRSDQHGIVIGLIMALVASPMLGVPLSVALAFFVPSAICCAFVIMVTLQPIETVAVVSFLGFLAFALSGTVHMNRTIRDRSIGRLSLQREHETIRVFLREYEEESSDWLWETDQKGCLRDVSARMASTLATSPGQLEGVRLERTLLPLEEPGDRHPTLISALSQQLAFRALEIAVQAGDTVRWISLTGHPLFSESGVFQGYRGIGSDITANQTASRQIAFMARHDGLTGLLNRAAFVDELERICARSETVFAVLMIDLDDFKGINDTFGHLEGDRLLRTVADRLRTTVGQGTVIGRLGGDEFAALLLGSDAQQAMAISRRLCDALQRETSLDAVMLMPGASIGLAMFPDHTRDASTLMKHADLALYRAKSRGKGVTCLFEPSLEQDRLDRIRLRGELIRALDRDEIVPAFQPIIDVTSGHMVSAEALARWHHPTRGLLNAGQFITVAERSAGDLIERLSERVLRLSCMAAVGWAQPIPVAVNLSPRQLRSGLFIPMLESCLSESGLPPVRLTLEVTEDVFLNADMRVLTQLARIREMGVRIVLDDFGTGYSSLTYLRGFDVDGIKIDASFTRDLPQVHKVVAIVRTIGRLAADMNIYVVAEGVETDGQLAWLRANGIAFAQGFLLGRPDWVPRLASQLDQLVDKSNS